MAIRVLARPTYGLTFEVTNLSAGIAGGETIWWVEFTFWPGELFGADPTLGGLCATVGNLMTLALDGSWPITRIAA